MAVRDERVLWLKVRMELVVFTLIKCCIVVALTQAELTHESSRNQARITHASLKHPHAAGRLRPAEF